MKRLDKTKEYWNQNIANWGKFYSDSSHSEESFDAPSVLGTLYHWLITPIEAKLMKKRYQLTMNFIKNYVKEGMVVVDVGCGTGIFTIELLKRKAHVKAVDYAQSSLDLTKAQVEKLVPNYSENVEYLLMDVTKQQLPISDLVIAMGVTPYINNLEDFYHNILPTTTIFYCLIMNPKNWINIIRKFVPFLNIRKINWFEKALVDDILRRYNWKLVNREDFASGYLDIAIKKNSKWVDHDK
jgi:SAM-dependent methyltransferase